MSTYLTRRLLISLPVLLGITILTFLFINLAPGDPISALIDPQSGTVMTGEQLQALRESFGLNKPIPIRYLLWLKAMLQGNLGYSYYTQRPVTERIGQRIRPTLELAGVALLIAIVLGITLGLVSAFKHYSVLDYTLTLFSFAGLSVPEFFLALFMIYWLSLRLNLLPTSGMATSGTAWTLPDHLSHLVMPATILALRFTAVLMRYARSSLLEVLSQDYMTVARAKGLPEWVVIFRHALKNALIPLITIVGLHLPLLVSGAFILEVVFSWPGMGMLMYDAIFQRDYPVVMGVTLIIGIAVLISNLIADIAYGFADPRIKYE